MKNSTCIFGRSLFAFIILFCVNISVFAGADFWGTGAGLISYNIGSGQVNSYAAQSTGSADLGALTSFNLLGGIIHTWKDGSGNICGGTMYYTVYKNGSRPSSPTFSSVSLSWNTNGSFTTTAIPSGLSTTASTDQRWQNLSQSIDVLAIANTSGTWVLEVYWTCTGNTTSSSGCGTSLYFNNSGSNYKWTFSNANIPSITSFNASPNNGTATSGYIGSTVIITGTNLSSIMAVKIGGVNGTSATNFSATSTQVMFTAPDASGAIYVSNGVYSATGSPDYTSLGYITSQDGDWLSASSWLGGLLPADSKSTTVAHKMIISNSNVSQDNLIVNSGGELSIFSGKQLTVSTSLTNNGTLNLLSDGTNGTATILTPATIGGTGTTNVQQFLTGGRNWYISSPVASASSSIITGITGNALYSYDESTALWSSNPTSDANFVVAKGYVGNMASDGNIIFTGGALNNGTFTSQVLTSSGSTSKGFNLVGNPYPSYLNWLSVLASSSTSATIEPTMWYRTKNNATPTSAYVFDTFNATAGQGTNNNGHATVIGQIAPMQAFWVRVTAGNTGTLGFDNTMRSHQDQSITTNRLKDRALVNTAQQVLRLQVSNNVNSDEAVVLFNSNASNGYDAYDSEKMSNNDASIPEIYTTVGNEKLVINGLNSIPTDTEIPLGFSTGQSNTFSIKATEISNFDAGIKVYLKDNFSSTQKDLTDGSAYTFASDVASTTGRFSLIFKSVGVTTGVQTASGDRTVLIYKNANNQIAVNCTGAIRDRAFVSVYNALGQKLEAKQITSATTVIDKAFTSGVYVVTVNNGGMSTTQKVILH